VGAFTRLTRRGRGTTGKRTHSSLGLQNREKEKGKSDRSGKGGLRGRGCPGQLSEDEGKEKIIRSSKKDCSQLERQKRVSIMLESRGER